MGAAQSSPSPPAAAAPTPGPTPPAGCPMHESSASPLNPLNNIPTLAQAPSTGQKTTLPLHRTLSTIPRASSSSDSASACPVAHGSTSTSAPPSAAEEKAKVDAWEYPSPQQFYNALVRKGWETPEESVEMMVHIHNWLNEAAWQQVRTWEEKHQGGDRSSLARFQGRPQDLSPKARYHLMLGKLLPSKYDYVKPFDRHDWEVHRPAPPSSSSSYTSASPSQPYTNHRYVIDYYALPDDEQGNPVFSLDVRPAVDSVGALQERLAEWWKVKKETWGGEGSATLGVRVQEDK